MTGDAPIKLPEELFGTTVDVDFLFPNANECMFGHSAEKWLEFSDICASVQSGPAAAVKELLDTSQSESIAAFGDFWNNHVLVQSAAAADTAQKFATILTLTASTISTYKTNAIRELDALHDFLDRAVWWTWLPFADSAEEVQQQNKATIDIARDRLAKQTADAKELLNLYADQMRAVQESVKQIAVQIHQLRKNLQLD
ncbi:hypothetical protein [Nonomuraea recticatena]|uniref:hypothetical protein n=1 Tax=Nonomuraea recticatena TaxID=46178 RepID=UPI0031F963D9